MRPRVVVVGRDVDDPGLQDEVLREAYARAAQALRELRVEGIKTTAPLHVRLVEAVQKGPVHTIWLEGWLE